jgi:hypothetical protein
MGTQYNPEPKTAHQKKQNDKVIEDLWRQRERKYSKGARKRYRKLRREQRMNNEKNALIHVICNSLFKATFSAPGGRSSFREFVRKVVFSGAVTEGAAPPFMGDVSGSNIKVGLTPNRPIG